MPDRRLRVTAAVEAKDVVGVTAEAEKLATSILAQAGLSHRLAPAWRQ